MYTASDLNDPQLHNESLLFKRNTWCADHFPMLSTLNSIKLYDHVYLVCLVMLQIDSNKGRVVWTLMKTKDHFLYICFM